MKSIQYKHSYTTNTHEKVFIFSVVFNWLLSCLCPTFLAKCLKTATNNISLLYITVNWSAATVRIITCWCLRLGREGLHSATNSGEFPFPFFFLRPASRRYFSQMPTENWPWDRRRGNEREMDSVSLIRDTLWKTLVITGFVYKWKNI